MHKIQLFIGIQALAAVTPFGTPKLQRRHAGYNYGDVVSSTAQYQPQRTATRLHGTNHPQEESESIHSTNNNSNDGGSSYDSSASLTKGVVSSLTSLSTSIFEGGSTKLSQDILLQSSLSSSSSASTLNQPPTSPQELLSRIQNEYIINNYLWTGKLDTSSFVSNCTFTDPTLSFVGVDTYVKNVGSLVPVVDYLLGDNDDDEQQQKVLCQSDLLSITLNDKEKYIETRWNMIGELNRLFWKPKIDVIGRTKFWYQEVMPDKQQQLGGEDEVIEEQKLMQYQVYFYDEEWEIPAGLALLQLVTKAGTIANTSE